MNPPSVRKANRGLGVMMRSLQIGNARGVLKGETNLAAYFGKVRSVLEYGGMIWAGAAAAHPDRLDSVHR